MSRPDERTPTRPNLDAILHEARQRKEKLDQLQHIQERFAAKMHQVADSLRNFQATLPTAQAFYVDAAAPVISPEQRAALADALLALCQIVRETDFSPG